MGHRNEINHGTSEEGKLWYMGMRLIMWIGNIIKSWDMGM